MPSKQKKAKKSPAKSKRVPPKITPENRAAQRITRWNHKRLEETAGPFDSGTPLLNLSKLGLKAFPEAVRDLYELEVLDLLGNRITHVPLWIRELVALKAIRLSENPMKRLPREIGYLPKLTVLTAERMNLTELPDTLNRLQLKELDLGGNPELRLPESILRRPPKDIISSRATKRVALCSNLN